MREKSLIRVAAALTTATWVVVVLIRGAKFDLSLLTSFGVVVAAVVFLMASLDLYLWRLPAVNRIFRSGAPLIRGTWSGEVHSSRREEPFKVFVVITQTLSRISVRMLTEDGWSETLSSRWGVSDDRNPAVFYLWRRFPSSPEESTDAAENPPGYIRHGAGILEVCGEREYCLKGPYWTDEKHTGRMLFEHHKHRVCRSYGDAASLFFPTV